MINNNYTMYTRGSITRREIYADCVDKIAKEKENKEKGKLAFLTKRLVSPSLAKMVYKNINPENYNLIVDNFNNLRNILLYGYDFSMSDSIDFIENNPKLLFSNKNRIILNLATLSLYNYDKETLLNNSAILLEKNYDKLYSCLRNTNSYEEFVMKLDSQEVTHILPDIRKKVIYCNYIDKLNEVDKNKKLLLKK